MITIQVFGLDQFVVGRYSRDNTGALAQLFQCTEDDVSFYAPNAMMFHNGVEQTSWDVLIVVLAPNRFASHEDEVADYIGKTLANFALNIDVIFRYFDEENRHSYRNTQYPRFITRDEIRDQGATLRFGDLPEDEEYEESDEESSAEGEEEVYLGNAFEGFEERYEASLKKKNEN